MVGKTNMNLLDFYKGKRIFVTGHTGFKGSWLCKILAMSGANVTGYSLNPVTEPNLFDICGIEKEIKSFIGDIRDLKKLETVFNKCQPEIVFHLAAQPIVKESYKDPVYTYSTNVMGTVNILECIRKNDFVKSFVNVTTDKVYKNNEWEWGYRENDLLDGFDPYSNSKSCSELVTSSYKKSFFIDRKVAISTVRAGNVIGGGDFSIDRIIPDCVRAAQNGECINIRNPYSVRPYQYVLEPLYVYLMIAKKQYEEIEFADNYNVGPEDNDCVTTGNLIDIFCEKWGNEQKWNNKVVEGPHEANFLKLDCSKLKNRFNWKSQSNVEIAVEKTVEWFKKYIAQEDIITHMEKEIREFFMANNKRVASNIIQDKV